MLGSELHGSNAPVPFGSATRGAIVMLRAFAFGVLTTIIVALIGGYLVLRNGMIPANADATPTWLET